MSKATLGVAAALGALTLTLLTAPPSMAAASTFTVDVSALPLHTNSDAFIDSIGRQGRVHPDFGTEWEGAPIGIPFTTV